MDLLQQTISSETGLIRRGDLPHMGKEHPVIVLLDANRTAAFPSLNHNLDLAILLPLRLQDPAQCSNRIDLIGRWLVERRVMLGGEKNISLTGHGLLKSTNGARPSDLECHLREWEYY